MSTVQPQPHPESQESAADRPGLFRLKLLRSHAIFSLLTALIVAAVTFHFLQGRLADSHRQKLALAREYRLALASGGAADGFKRESALAALEAEIARLESGGDFRTSVWSAALLILATTGLVVFVSVYLARKKMGPMADLLVLWGRELEDTVRERTRALEKSERTYRLLAESVADGEVILQDGRAAYANSAFRGLVGFPDQGYEGTPLCRWVTESDASRMEQREKLRCQGIAPPARYRLKLRDGRGTITSAEVVEKEIEYAGRPACLLSIRDLGAIRRLRLYETTLPTCCVCKAVRDDSEHVGGVSEWISLEKYVLRHTDALMSHTYCPECEKELLSTHNLA